MCLKHTCRFSEGYLKKKPYIKVGFTLSRQGKLNKNRIFPTRGASSREKCDEGQSHLGEAGGG
jgi:hypothetical protein